MFDLLKYLLLNFGTMSRQKSAVSFPLVHTHASGIDIGSKSNWVCIGRDKDEVREFGVFTEDHHKLAKWLKNNGIRSVAMESTGIYWKSLFLILQAHDFEVILVNARHIKNVRGKKTDVQDCQWIWQLHCAGLLSASFQPDEFTEELRTYNRQRRTLIQGASRFVTRMQKALVLMNLQLPVVLSDITGKSGQAIIKAILQGERDSKQLAELADPRVKASKTEIAKALTGYWHAEQLFVLQQSWQMYQTYLDMIAKCDEQIETSLASHIEQKGQHDLVYEPVKKKPRYKNAPIIDIDKYAYQLSDGVDLMQIDGVSYNTVLTLVAEVGLDLGSYFPTHKHFVSWLGLCPNRKVTGGRVLSSKSKKNKNRLAVAFRQAANTVGRQKDTALSHFFRRIAFRKGRKVAITATARKLAVIVYEMLVNKESYRQEEVTKYEEKVRKQKVKHIQKTMKRFNIEADDLVLN